MSESATVRPARGRRHSPVVPGPRALLCEMLELAVDQARGRRLNIEGGREPRVQWRHRDSARQWLLNLHGTSLILPAALACDAARLDHDVIKDRLLRAGDLRWTPIPPCKPPGGGRQRRHATP